MKKISTIIVGLMLAVSVLFCGCNTVEGVGEDIEEGGDRIEDAAD